MLSTLLTNLIDPASLETALISTGYSILIGLCAALAVLKIPNPLLSNVYFRPAFLILNLAFFTDNSGNNTRTSTMNKKAKHEFSPRIKRYVVAFSVNLAFLGGIVLLGTILAQKGVSFISSLLIIFLLLSPGFIIWLYVLYKTLIPITGGMPLQRLSQWALLYPFIAGYGFSWALLAMFFDYSLPFLSREDREIFLPLLSLLCIILVLSLTRLRHRVARLINRIFGTEPTEEPSDIPNV